MKTIAAIVLTIFLTFFLTKQISAQDTVRIASYNMLAYSGITSDTTLRNPSLRTIMSSLKPDILVVQEINGRNTATGFLTNVLKAVDSNYVMGPFRDSFDSERAIFFKSNKFQSFANVQHATSLRDINEFKLIHKISGDTLRLFGLHLKAGTNTSDINQRAGEAAVLRKAVDSLSETSLFLALGDYNIYGADEPAYVTITSDGNNPKTKFYDPLTMPGVWQNSFYALYHTQSPRTTVFGGGSAGGLDDRLDIIFMSPAIKDSQSVYMIGNSYRAFGNDGNRYNQAVNWGSNGAVGNTVAQALHDASDHLPVVANFVFKKQSVSIDSGELPKDFSLEQNFPNPFNPSTTIRYAIPEESNVTLRVFNTLGELVSELIRNEVYSPGTYDIAFNADTLPSGLYVYQLVVEGVVYSKAMMLIK